MSEFKNQTQVWVETDRYGNAHTWFSPENLECETTTKPELAPTMEQTGGKKNDSNLPPLVQGCLMYFPKALMAVANVSKFGTQKYKVDYADQDWRRVENAEVRYRDALGRHLVKGTYEAYDQETKLLHAAHSAWDSLAVLELMLTKGISETQP